MNTILGFGLIFGACAFSGLVGFAAGYYCCQDTLFDMQRDLLIENDDLKRRLGERT